MAVAISANKGFWQDRPTFVTDGSGLLGGWLVRRLLEANADVISLVRDWVPQSELVRSLMDSVKVVRGEVRDQVTLERIFGEYEIDTMIHLAAQTIVGNANRNPVSTGDLNWNRIVPGTDRLVQRFLEARLGE